MCAKKSLSQLTAVRFRAPKGKRTWCSTFRSFSSCSASDFRVSNRPMKSYFTWHGWHRRYTWKTQKGRPTMLRLHQFLPMFMTPICLCLKAVSTVCTCSILAAMSYTMSVVIINSRSRKWKSMSALKHGESWNENKKIRFHFWAEKHSMVPKRLSGLHTKNVICWKIQNSNG